MSHMVAVEDNGAHDNGRTSDILTNFRSISHMAGIHVRYASMKHIAITKPGLLLNKFFCGSEVMRPYCK